MFPQYGTPTSLIADISDCVVVRTFAVMSCAVLVSKFRQASIPCPFAGKLKENKRLLFIFKDKKTYNEFVYQILRKTALARVTLKIPTLRARIKPHICTGHINSSTLPIGLGILPLIQAVMAKNVSAISRLKLI